MTLDDWLKQKSALAEAATSGPWELEDPTTRKWSALARNITSSKGCVVYADEYFLDANERDFAFILDARMSLPKALEIIGVLRDALKLHHEHWCAPPGSLCMAECRWTCEALAQAERIAEGER